MAPSKEGAFFYWFDSGLVARLALAASSFSDGMDFRRIYRTTCALSSRDHARMWPSR